MRPAIDPLTTPSSRSPLPRRGPARAFASPRRRPFFRRAFSLLAPLAATLHAEAAAADPQANVALTTGVSAAGLGDHPHAAFHLGARADLLLLRHRDRDMAVGPYVDFASTAFARADAGGGVEWLWPLWDAFPFVVGAGAFERFAPGGPAPGVVGSLFWGSRGYNFDSWYGLSAGLLLEGRRAFGDLRQTDVLLALQLDLTLFAYPFLFAYEAARH